MPRHRKENILKLLARRTKCEVDGCLNLDLRLDHNHSTGKIRGWICSFHNFMIGMAKDSSESLKATAKYLEVHFAIQGS